MQLLEERDNFGFTVPGGWVHRHRHHSGKHGSRQTWRLGQQLRAHVLNHKREAERENLKWHKSFWDPKAISQWRMSSSKATFLNLPHIVINWRNKYWTAQTMMDNSSKPLHWIRVTLILIDRCAGLNEKCPPETQSLHTWSPIVGTVWGGFGAVALLEEVCYWGRALRIYNLNPLPVRFLCFEFVVEGVVSWLPAPDGTSVTCWWTHPTGPTSQKKFFMISSFCHGILFQQQASN